MKATISQILDFIRTAKEIGSPRFVCAALPRKHPLVVNREVSEIRSVKGVVASYVDELGNTVELGADGIVRQQLWKPRNLRNSEDACTILPIATVKTA
ncbi:hypothetical protein ACI2KR_06840 [Pseudomonas luteola]